MARVRAATTPPPRERARFMTLTGGRSSEARAKGATRLKTRREERLERWARAFRATEDPLRWKSVAREGAC
jgi:hypothetical protein